MHIKTEHNHIPYDIIIGGAGCAGLSLAQELLSSAIPDMQRILIIDKENKNGAHTIGFWENDKGHWDSLTIQTWKKICVINTNGKKITQSITPYNYKLVAISEIKKKVIQTLKTHPHFDYTGDTIKNIRDETNQVIVLCENAVFSCLRFFDSTPLYTLRKNLLPKPIKQQFVGLFIKTSSPFFDHTKATFMDFRLPQDAYVRFAYCLPINSKECLIEITAFTPNTIPFEQLTFNTKDFIEKIMQIKEYEILNTEKGLIHMGQKVCYNPPSQKIIPIGVNAGLLKSSTGYGFNNIQKDSKRIVKCLLEKKKVIAHKIKKRHHVYDILMLAVLCNPKYSIPSVYWHLLTQNKTPRFFSFLDENTSFFNEITIMWKSPKRLFIRSIFQQIQHLFTSKN